jgi:hypothetical protein
VLQGALGNPLARSKLADLDQVEAALRHVKETMARQAAGLSSP